MAITKMKMESEGMQRAIKFVKAMTKSMTFDEHMAEANWPKARKRNDLFYRLMPKIDGVKFKKIKWNNVKAMQVKTSDATDDLVIIYLHGGGFVTGSAYVCKSYTSMLSKYAKCPVYAIDYRLAPEHPYPAGFDDCCAGYEEVVALHPNAKIALIGESAGGNYCLALTHKYKADKKIGALIVHSPTVDFTGEVDHHINENKDFIVKLGVSPALKSMYVGDNDPTNPYISPICGDFTDFPPTYITCDVNETLYGDSKALYEKCEAAGVKIQMVEAEGAYHAFAVTGTNAPETTKILEENVAFMRN